MAARRHSRPAAPGAGGLRPGELAAGRAAAEPLPAEAPVWLTLTDLGRLYGISAMHCGRLLSAAGLRDCEGHPTDQALQSGCASPQRQRQGGQPFWHRQHCGGAFQAAGLVTVQRATLVQQWADLLSALAAGSPSISTSAAQMAEEMPMELLEPVNQQLRRLGCSFQVQRTAPRLTRGGAAMTAVRREMGPPGAAVAVRRPRTHGASG